MPGRFLTTGIPLTDTFSFRKERPCRFEQPSQPARAAPPSAKQECPYRLQCDSTSGRLPLRHVYGRSIKVTLTEASSSIVVRSEHQYSRDERHRLCLRKHVYELDSDPVTRFKVTRGVQLAVERHLEYERKTKKLSLSREDIQEILKCLQKAGDEADEFLRKDEFDLCIGGLKDLLSGLGIPEPDGNKVIDLVTLHATASLACHPIGRDERLAKYLGFVDIRTNSILAPLAMGLLVPPRHLRHDPDVTIAAGEYGRIFGAHGFTSTVYSMHDPEAGGAHCAQACVIMALAMLADRGAKVLGSYDLTCLGKDPIQPKSEDAACLEQQAGYDGAFAVDGLNADEIVKLLRRDECRTSVYGLRSPFTITNFRECKRLIEAYVSARYPVIMLVDTAEWWEQEKSEGHAVVIVGLRRARQKTSEAQGSEPNARQASVVGSPLGEVTELIVHDPGDRPFAKRPIRDSLRASWAFAKSEKHRAKFHLIFVSEARNKQHAHQCLKAIRDRDEDRWEKYCAVPGTCGTGDYRIALLHRNEIVKKYTDPSHDIGWIRRKCKKEDDKLDEKDLKMKRRFEKLRTVADNIPNGLYWCVAGYDGHELEVLWLFNAEREPSGQWDYRANFNS